MRKGSWWPVPVCLAVVLFASGCGSHDPASAPASTAGEPGKLAVHVVNYPLSYFAERIGGERVHVEFPAPADVDPAFWSPDADTVAGFQAADLILLNGAGYAKWVERTTLAPSKLVDTSANLRDRYVEIESAVTHSHGPEGAHDHGEIAFTTWLDPELAVAQARAILQAFSAARPEFEESFAEGFAALERDLLEIDAALRGLFGETPAQPLVASHPVYQYLANRYDLDLRSVHFEPDEYPDERNWKALEHLLSEHAARWVLWEGAPLTETSGKLADLGVQSVVFDPCGNVPEQGDYVSVMQGNVNRLGEALAKPGE